MTRNSTTTIRFKILAAVMAVAMLTPVFLFAGPGRGGDFGPQGRHGGPGFHGPPGLHGLRGLDLTEEQRTQIHDLLTTHRDENAEAREALWNARAALGEAIHAATFDEGAVRQAAQTLAGLEENQAVERAQLFQEVRQILTEEQLQELEAMRQEHEERRQDRRDRRSSWGGPAGESSEG